MSPTLGNPRRCRVEENARGKKAPRSRGRQAGNGGRPQTRLTLRGDRVTKGTSGAPIVFPFARGYEKQPYTAVALRKQGCRQASSSKPLFQGPHRRRYLHACVEACSRQEVSESIGLGSSLSQRAIVVERHSEGLTSQPVLPDP